METAALTAVMLCFAVIFGVVVPRAPVVGAVLTVLGPLCPMPPLLCDALDLAPGACSTMLTFGYDPTVDGTHGILKYYLILLWLTIPIGMQQSKQRGELYDLQGQMVFYKSYHSDPINVAIHALCIPIILWTALGLCAMTAPILDGAPLWMDWSLFPALLYSSYYLQMAQPASPVLACMAAALVLIGWMVHHTPSISPSIDTLSWLHVGSWLAQFWGHGVHERRKYSAPCSAFRTRTVPCTSAADCACLRVGAPALLSNLSQVGSPLLFPLLAHFLRVPGRLCLRGWSSCTRIHLAQQWWCVPRSMRCCSE